MSRKGFHRYLRVEDAFPKREPDADGYWPCRACGLRCASRTHRACSVECRKLMDLVSSPGSQRWAVEARDHGVCSQCGFDTEAIRKALRRKSVAIAKKVRCERGYNSLGSLWEMDHIVPVSEGGGVYPGITADEILGNLRTLCVPCHKGRRAVEVEL